MMKNLEIDTRFINYLQVPAFIMTFDGEILDMNDVSIRNSGASSKGEYLRINARELLFDVSKFRKAITALQTDKKVVAWRTILKTFNSTLVFRTVNMVIISEELRWVFASNYGPFDGNTKLLNQVEDILKKSNLLIPFMSKQGVDNLKNINNINNTSYELEFERGLALIFARELNKHYPQLSKTELYVCALLTFGYTTKEIEYISTYSLNKIRVNISRACKKLNKLNREDLVVEFCNFLKNIYEF